MSQKYDIRYSISHISKMINRINKKINSFAHSRIWKKKNHEIVIFILYQFYSI